MLRIAQLIRIFIIITIIYLFLYKEAADGAVRSVCLSVLVTESVRAHTVLRSVILGRRKERRKKEKKSEKVLQHAPPLILPPVSPIGRDWMRFPAQLTTFTRSSSVQRGDGTAHRGHCLMGLVSTRTQATAAAVC